jgi:hypothetical protein
MSTNDQQQLESYMGRLRDELISLLTDQDTYWKTQEVIKSNVRLMGMRSAFFDLFNDSYVYSTMMALRRLSETSNQVVSLMNVLLEIKQHPDLAPDVDSARLAEDIAKLKNLGMSVREYADKYIAHHDRQRKPTEFTFSDIKGWVSVVQEIFRRYYAAILRSDIELVIDYLEDPMRIFTFAWIQECATA